MGTWAWEHMAAHTGQEGVPASPCNEDVEVGVLVKHADLHAIPLGSMVGSPRAGPGSGQVTIQWGCTLVSSWGPSW